MYLTKNNNETTEAYKEEKKTSNRQELKRKSCQSRIYNSQMQNQLVAQAEVHESRGDWG